MSSVYVCYLSFITTANGMIIDDCEDEDGDNKAISYIIHILCVWIHFLSTQLQHKLEYNICVDSIQYEQCNSALLCVVEEGEGEGVVLMV